jgi:hypothetical protein
MQLMLDCRAPQLTFERCGVRMIKSTLVLLFAFTLFGTLASGQRTPERQSELLCEPTASDYFVYTAVLQDLGMAEDPEES